MAPQIVPVKVGDVVRLKKPHPCGVNEWEIDRIGADIGLRCAGCGRRVMLPRSEFDRRFRGFIRRAEGDTGSRGSGGSEGSAGSKASAASEGPSDPGATSSQDPGTD